MYKYVTNTSRNTDLLPCPDLLTRNHFLSPCHNKLWRTNVTQANILFAFNFVRHILATASNAIFDTETSARSQSRNSLLYRDSGSSIGRVARPATLPARQAIRNFYRNSIGSVESARPGEQKRLKKPLLFPTSVFTITNLAISQRSQWGHTVQFTIVCTSLYGDCSEQWLTMSGLPNSSDNFTKNETLPLPSVWCFARERTLIYSRVYSNLEA